MPRISTNRAYGGPTVKKALSARPSLMSMGSKGQKAALTKPTGTANAMMRGNGKKLGLKKKLGAVAKVAAVGAVAPVAVTGAKAMKKRGVNPLMKTGLKKGFKKIPPGQAKKRFAMK